MGKGGQAIIKSNMGKGGQSTSVDQENMAAWCVGVNTIKIQPFKLPSIGPNDVRVRMRAVVICGSDVHYLKTMKFADYVVNEPMGIRHECAGFVTEIGSEVKNLVRGDRVAVEPGIRCFRCQQCKGGRYNLCPDMKFFATPPVDGSLANQIVHPADQCFKLPENVSLEEGAMCEPLSVGVHACERAKVGPGTAVLVIGAGLIGQFSVLAARAFGAPKIVVVDMDGQRLALAKSLGVDETVKVSENMDLDDEVAKIKEAMGGEVDVSFDCVGSNKSMSTGLNTTRSGGKVCIVGMAHGMMNVPLPEAAAREVDVVGVFRYKNTWPVCLDFLRTGKIDVKPLLAHFGACGDYEKGKQE
ncbi:hypothetical protein C1H46_033880 [Malus baccata]|uniref:Enoyl reductase (ER) domain-containing protein n=1 Tax=Malus baccata TaxID=106549 RepID=A0A540L261_MALBA|nr:hypothetical protein C1H46_033880 [Malus baccata]